MIQEAKQLEYATPSRPRWSRLAMTMFALCFAVPASVFAILINVRHSQVCPNCGGWGAGIGVGLAGAMLLGSLWSLAHCIRQGANIASIILAAMSLAGAAVFLLATIGFYFAIQA